VAHQFPRQPPFAVGPGLRPSVPDPFALAARRFERTGAELYLHDPVGFARDCVRWKPGESLAPYQTEVLSKLVQKRRVAVRGPHGLGKTTTKAFAILWFAITREGCKIDWKIPTTAGSWSQLRNYLWPEIHKWATRIDWGRLEMAPWRPDRELLTFDIKGRYGQAFASSPAKTELIEGAHADHIFFVFDESKAIPADIFDAAEGALSGDQEGIGGREAYALAQSTPGEPQGRFFDIHQQKEGLTDWWVRHVRKTEVIAAGRMSPVWAEMRKLQWGLSSGVYQNRVEGEFFVQDSDSVIPVSWVEAANDRWVEWDRSGRPNQPGVEVFGADIARGGGDLTSIARRTGSVVSVVTTWNLADTTKIALRLKRKMAHQTDLAVVDVIGVGSGVVDLMRRWNVPVVAFNAARKSRRKDRSGMFGFVNQRAAMWWLLRETLDPAFAPTLAIPPDDDLLGELTAPKWRLKLDKIQVESKDDIRKRLGRSTDKADAVCQTMLTDAEFNQEPGHDEAEVFAYTDQVADAEMFVGWGEQQTDYPGPDYYRSQDLGRRDYT
jgi:hypothetical protein